MLQNAYFLAKIGADTAENEQHFAEILPIGRRAVLEVAQQAERPRAAARAAAGLRPQHRDAPRQPKGQAKNRRE